MSRSRKDQRKHRRKVAGSANTTKGKSVDDNQFCKITQRI
jgi:hypothetical protein